MPRPQARERRLELQRFVDRFAHELLDDGFAPRTERALPEAAAESLDPGDADAVSLVRVAVEHDDAGVGENLTHLVALARFEIVVAENGDDRHVDRRQLARQHTRFIGQSVVGQVAGNQQDVGRFGNLREERLKGALRGFGAVQIAERGHAHHACHARSVSTRVKPTWNA